LGIGDHNLIKKIDPNQIEKGIATHSHRQHHLGTHHIGHEVWSLGHLLNELFSVKTNLFRLTLKRRYEHGECTRYSGGGRERYQAYPTKPVAHRVSSATSQEAEDDPRWVV
jgi:hypothetical protein